MELYCITHSPAISIAGIFYYSVGIFKDFMFSEKDIRVWCYSNIVSIVLQFLLGNGFRAIHSYSNWRGNDILHDPQIVDLSLF